jgi:hypothetical protein
MDTFVVVVVVVVKGGGGVRAVKAFCNRIRSVYSMMRWAGHAAYVGEAGIFFYELSSQFEETRRAVQKSVTWARHVSGGWLHPLLSATLDTRD